MAIYRNVSGLYVHRLGYVQFICMSSLYVSGLEFIYPNVSGSYAQFILCVSESTTFSAAFGCLLVIQLQGGSTVTYHIGRQGTGASDG